MIFRRLLPKDGGGAMRRYIRFRKDMMKLMLATKDVDPFPPIAIFDFTNPDDAMDAERVHEKDQDAWRISDDRVIGGYSQSAAKLIRSKAELFRYAMGPSWEDHSNRDSGLETPAAVSDSEPFTPFLKWKGTIDTNVGVTSDVQRSGFAALRSPIFPLEGANLKGMYNALEITCRSDGRAYTINLRVDSLFPDDMYQGYLQQAEFRQDPLGNLAGPFETFVLPFRNFVLTSMGREREIQRQLGDKISIEHIGVALLDGETGDFQFDLARIRAVNLQGEKVFEGVKQHKDR